MCMTLYVSEIGTTLRSRGDALCVTARPRETCALADRRPRPALRQTLGLVPLERIQAVALLGRVNLTRPAVDACLSRGIAIGFFTLGGTLRGQLSPTSAPRAKLRLRQYRLLLDAPRQLAFARAIIRAKLSAAARVLHQLARPVPPEVRAACDELQFLLGRLAGAASIDALRGLEGAGGRAYFAALQALVPPGLGFTGRHRRPPTDPVNAALSLGYTLLTNLMSGLLELHGLDPLLGLYHQPWRSRPSLALDLIERFRQPVVDRWVVRLLRRNILRTEHFMPAPGPRGGVYLSPAGRRVFFPAWERHLAAPGADGQDVYTQFADEVEYVTHCIRRGRSYEPPASRVARPSVR